jgi:hypothetical protein
MKRYPLFDSLAGDVRAVSSKERRNYFDHRHQPYSYRRSPYRNYIQTLRYPHLTATCYQPPATKLALQ